MLIVSYYDLVVYYNEMIIEVDEDILVDIFVLGIKVICN